MTDFAISPANANVVVREDLAAMLAANELRAYRVRSNGTMRHMALYPLGSTGRDTAEWVSEQLNDGLSVARVARELHVSTAAVRRILLSLELTEDIEAGEYDGLLTGTGLYADSVEVELADEVAPEARPGANPEFTPAPAVEQAQAKQAEAAKVTYTVMDRGNRSTATPPASKGEAGGHFSNPTPAYPKATARKARSHG